MGRSPAEEAVPFPVAVHRRFALCRYCRRDTHLEGASFERATGRARHRKRFSRTANARYPRVDHDFHVNKIPIAAVAEGRGAQDMVALVPRRRIG